MRAVLCRPMGGLNDILCQIEACWRYAETYDRHLIIDTEVSGLLDTFSTYFVPRSGTAPAVSFSLADHMPALLEGDVRPACASADASRYKQRFSAEARNHVDAATGEKLTFDFETDHSEVLLIHHQCGGGMISIDALNRLELAPEIAEKVRAAISSLPESYASVHVRNTDMNTDYKTFFANIADRLAQKDVLICSDDRACIDYGHAFFTESRVHTVSDIPDTGGKPLHTNASLDRFNANLDMLVDLFCLANGRALHLTRVDRGFLSGFSRLAQSLHRDRDLLARFVGAGL